MSQPEEEEHASVEDAHSETDIFYKRIAGRIPYREEYNDINEEPSRLERASDQSSLFERLAKNKLEIVDFEHNKENMSPGERSSVMDNSKKSPKVVGSAIEYRGLARTSWEKNAFKDLDMPILDHASFIV